MQPIPPLLSFLWLGPNEGYSSLWHIGYSLQALASLIVGSSSKSVDSVVVVHRLDWHVWDLSRPRIGPVPGSDTALTDGFLSTVPPEVPTSFLKFTFQPCCMCDLSF